MKSLKNRRIYSLFSSEKPFLNYLILFIAFVLMLHFYYGVFLFGGQEVSAATYNYVVDNTGDQSDDNAGNGICHTAGGNCTFRAAIEEANADGGTTAITFSVTGTITVASNLPATQPVTIIGPGAASLTISGSNTQMPINLATGSAGSSVTALKLTNCSVAAGCIFLQDTTGNYSVTYMTLVNGFIRGNNAGNANITITNNTLSGDNGTISLIGSGVSDIVDISNNDFTIPGTAVLVAVLKVLGSNVTIDSNTMNCSSAVNVSGGISVGGYGGYTVTDNTVTNCGLSLAASGTGSIYINDVTDASPAVVTGNHTTGGSGPGIYFATGGASLSNINVSTNTISSAGEDGIYFTNLLGSGNNTAITGTIGSNTITGAGADGSSAFDAGIHLAKLADGTSLTVSNNSATTSVKEGLLMETVANGGVTVSGNTFSNSGTYGINLAATYTGGIGITGNTLNANATGIYLNSSGITGATISGNGITNSTERGILFSDYGASNSLTSNTVTGSGQDGVYIAKGPAVTSSGNTVSNNGTTVSSAGFTANMITPSYSGNTYIDTTDNQYSSQTGFGNLEAIDGADVTLVGADGVNNFNLALINLTDAGLRVTAFFRNDFVSTSGAAKTECETWGLGACTVDVWYPSAFTANGATSSYTFATAGIAAAGVTIAAGTPAITYNPAGYNYYGFYIKSDVTGAPTFTNETLTGNGNGFYLDYNGVTIASSSISSLGNDIAVVSGVTGTTVTNTTYTTFSITGNATVSHQVRARVLDEQGNPSSGVVVAATAADGTAYSLGTTDGSGLTGYLTLNHNIVSGVDPANPFSFSASGNQGSGTASATINTKNQQVDINVRISRVITPVCNNSVVETGEECDHGALNGTAGDSCSATCTNIIPINCGNGTIDTGETCDDGNVINGDGCSFSCQLETPLPVCNNGVVETGEQCDHGALNGTAGDSCSATCTNIIPVNCGNGSLDAGEACDDGTALNGTPNHCNKTCSAITTPECNNGAKETGEFCDDGIILNGQPNKCNTTCTALTTPVCGNSSKEADEDCDDGNIIDNDGCSSLCQVEAPLPFCGNGKKETGEECDHGSRNGQDGNTCSTACEIVVILNDNANVNTNINTNTNVNINTNANTNTDTNANTAGSGQTEELVNVPEEVLEITIPTTEALSQEVSLTASLLKETPGIKQIVNSPITKYIQREIFDNPLVESLNQDVAVPVIVAAIAANTIAALPSLGLLPYLHLIFTEPFRFLFFRRRKYGAVYNSLTKQPVDLAIVRLYDATTNKLVSTQVTDSKGRYSFVAEPGQYYLKVQKENYVFPSDILGQKLRDHDYADLYYGAPLRLTDQETTVNLNIPLDTNLQNQTDKEILAQSHKNSWKKVIAYLGPILSLISLAISPTKLIAVIFLVHLVLFTLFKRLALNYRPKSFGLIFDSTSQAAVKKAIVRIFDTEYNKLLATQVANSQGKYNFLVGPNKYYLTVSNPDYQPYKSDHLDFSNRPEAVIDQDVGLRKK